MAWGAKPSAAQPLSASNRYRLLSQTWLTCCQFEVNEAPMLRASGSFSLVFFLVALGCSGGPADPPDASVRDAAARDAFVPLRCLGAPVPCGERSVGSCDHDDGCAPTRCFGTPTDCERFGFGVCDQVVGCRQTSAGCLGVPVGCSTFFVDTDCSRQRGCDWAATPMICGGVATSCDTHGIDACGSVPGCTPEVREPDPVDAGSLADARSFPSCAGECDVYDPGSCGEGMHCRPSPAGDFCIDSSTVVAAEGEECILTEDCAYGNLCLPDGDAYRCVRFCHPGSVGECGPDRECTGVLGVGACIAACVRPPVRCDPFVADCEDTTTTCSFSRAKDGTPAMVCLHAGTTPANSPCGPGISDECERGSNCVPDPDVSHGYCRHLCDPGGSTATCLSTQECREVPGFGVGFCSDVPTP
jgi:hypothetical protein